jgi:hypothetical protein
MSYVAQQFAEAIPGEKEPSVVKWATNAMRLFGGRNSVFQPDVTPWTAEPIECTDDGITRELTFVKPIRAGGSVVGQIALNRWLSFEVSGNINYNWENDEKSDEQWAKEIEKTLKGCASVMRRWPVGERGKENKGLIIFPHCYLAVQGAFTKRNLTSSTIRFIINEEIHNWEPGRLALAYGRASGLWNSFILNISNASDNGDQLHQKFLSGTQQHWEVKCPGCSEYHVMRIRWDDKKPELGGLRYDADGCRTGLNYNYNKLAPTVRYQMPCGHVVRDEVTERRTLSMSGRYSLPRNTGASIEHRSFTLSAVSVDYLPWLELIQKKHEALRARRMGDNEPWKTYIKELECNFYDRNDAPSAGRVEVMTLVKKNRDGMPNRKYRFGQLDYQQGKIADGELPHWWATICDADERGNNLLVFEGKLLTEEDAAAVMRDHGVKPTCVVVDSGFHAITTVYSFCLKHGFNALKGEKQLLFSHGEGKGSRIFSPPKSVSEMAGRGGPMYEMVQYEEDDGSTTLDYAIEEPLFYRYSKDGIRDRYDYIRSPESGIRCEVPGDVSQDFLDHHEAEEIRDSIEPKTGAPIKVRVQVRDRNDLYVCRCYFAMQLDMAGVIGQGATIKMKEAK